MSIRAKKIIEDRFWILEDDDKKIGTLRRTEKGALITILAEEHAFDDFDSACDALGIDLTLSTEEKEITSVFEYPTNVPAFNIMWDTTRKLPLFTKTQKSQSFHAAGYYIIKFENSWAKSFCPKAITLASYNYEGPFKTKLEMTERFRLTNG